ncbi:hypothetical protein SynROS8604_01798 [Synechococcus sp. ROS8604]|nr:hypothetical protein SynROS8604_01798 [Synechococcus sp. ROS8604]
MPVMRQSYGNTSALQTISVPFVQPMSDAPGRKPGPGNR